MGCEKRLYWTHGQCSQWPEPRALRYITCNVACHTLRSLFRTHAYPSSALEAILYAPSPLSRVSVACPVRSSPSLISAMKKRNDA